MIVKPRSTLGAKDGFDYFKITMIKQLREMLSDRGYGTVWFKDAKEIVESLMENQEIHIPDELFHSEADAKTIRQLDVIIASLEERLHQVQELISVQKRLIELLDR